MSSCYRKFTIENYSYRKVICYKGCYSIGSFFKVNSWLKLLPAGYFWGIFLLFYRRKDESEWRIVADILLTFETIDVIEICLFYTITSIWSIWFISMLNVGHFFHFFFFVKDTFSYYSLACMDVWRPDWHNKYLSFV